MQLRDLVLIRLGVAVNLVIGQLVAALLLPFYLDSMGTMLVAALVGPRAAIITGLTSQVLAAVLSGNFTWLPFGIVQVAIAIYAAGAARVGVFRSLRSALPAGLLLGVISTSLSSPISYYVFGGATAGGVSALTAALRVVGIPLWLSVAIAGGTTDLVDKTVCFGLVCLILRNLPSHLAARFPALAH